MDGVFHCDDFMAIGSSKEALIFHFAQQEQKVENFSNNIILVQITFIFLLMVIKKLELIKLVDNQIGDLIAFK